MSIYITSHRCSLLIREIIITFSYAMYVCIMIKCRMFSSFCLLHLYIVKLTVLALTHRRWGIRSQSLRVHENAKVHRKVSASYLVFCISDLGEVFHTKYGLSLGEPMSLLYRVPPKQQQQQQQQ